MTTPARPDRRRFLGRAVSAATVFAAAGCASSHVGEHLARTPYQGPGPFYPDELPLDTDNDLVRINEATSAAVGEITHLGGRVLDIHGHPIRNAVVEIWQVDSNGVYLHKDSDNREKYDRNFQGYGRFLTASDGAYGFRTVKPVPYPGRKAPHIHIRVRKGSKRLITTQLYIRGYPGNRDDDLFNEFEDKRARELVLIDFKPIRGSRIGELSARADVIVGATPEQA